MDGYIVQDGIGMARGSLARIEDGKGVLVHVRDGELWITQEGDRRDYLIKTGGRFQVDREGVAIIYAVRRSALTLTAPAPTHYARRISVVPTRACLPRVLYDRSQERGAWFDAARHRLKSAIAPLLLVFAAAACEPVADAVFPVQANPAEKGVRYELTGYASPDSVEDGQVYEYH